MEKHSKNRQVICLLCLDRVTKFGAVIKDGSSLHQIINDFLISDYNVDDPRLPNGLCPSCRIKLQKLGKLDFSFVLPELPDYSSMVNFRQLRSSTSVKGSPCLCFLCKSAGRRSQFGNRGTLSKLPRSRQFSRRETNGNEERGGPLDKKPGTSTMCMTCFQFIYPGCRHPCNTNAAIENVKRMVPQRVLQIAAQETAELVTSPDTITTQKLSSRGPDFTWVKVDQNLKRAQERETKKMSQINFSTLDNIRLEAGLSCKKIKTVARHIRKSVPVQPHFDQHLANENKKFKDLFEVSEVVIPDQEESIIVVSCTDVCKFLSIILEERGVDKEDVVFRLSIDEGKGFLKITSSLVMKRELKGHFKSGGVKCIQILALSPCKESYDTIKVLVDRLDLVSVFDAFPQVIVSQDLKCVNLCLGIGAHASAFPCAFCHWENGK